MRAWVELPRAYGWGPTRALAGSLGKAGYVVTEIRSARNIHLALSGQRAARPDTTLPADRNGQRMALLEKISAGMPQRPDGGLIPVLPALQPVLPAGGLAKGSIVAVDRPGALYLALAAGGSQDGMWCAIAGVPSLGVLAAAECGIQPARMMLVREPGERWPEVTATLLDACEIVLLHPPPGRVPAAARRRLETTAQRTGAVLIVAGRWDGAPVRLRIGQQIWEGAGDGWGRLRARRAEVITEGRGAAAQTRQTWLWLPGPDGAITAASAPRIQHSTAEDQPARWRGTGGP